MQAWVIDSKMLQSVELRQHFRRSPIYKQESLDGVRHGLSIVGGHPDQTILLQSGDYIARLYPEVAEVCVVLWRRFVMAANALVQTRIDADIMDRATAVLQNMGLTVSDAVRILLTRTANEGSLPLEMVGSSDAHDAWFRAKVLEGLEDTRPDYENADAEARFRERRRAAVLRKPGAGDR